MPGRAPDKVVAPGKSDEKKKSSLLITLGATGRGRVGFEGLSPARAPKYDPFELILAAPLELAPLDTWRPVVHPFCPVVVVVHPVHLK